MTDDQRLGPPPIEPLSEAAWSRVERGVWSQLDAERPAAPAPSGPRRWWLVAAPLAAAAAVLALVIAVRSGPTALDEPSRVVSGAAPSSVLFGDSHIELDAATALSMRHEAERPTVTLEHGGAWFTVAPRLSRPAFIVRAGDATVRVVGTKFRVSRSGEQIAVEVERGLVDVNFRGSEVAIGAGRRWSSDAPGQIGALAAAAPAVDPAAPVTAAPAPEAEAPAPPAPDAVPAPSRPTHRPARPAAGSAGARTEPRLGSPEESRLQSGLRSRPRRSIATAPSTTGWRPWSRERPTRRSPATSRSRAGPADGPIRRCSPPRGSRSIATIAAPRPCSASTSSASRAGRTPPTPGSCCPG